MTGILDSMNLFSQKFPKISIVTPSFNQGQFLEHTILSVLGQKYLNLEYIIIDGGSTDNSVDIIKKYEDGIYYWCSEPDEGHYSAINKGFEHATGEVFAWLNSDDMYCPWALRTVGSVFAQFPSLKWLTTLNQLMWNKDGDCIYVKNIPGYSKRAFLDGCYFSQNKNGLGFIQQESTFWKRDLWEKVDGIRAKYSLAGDFDLWARFYEHANLYGIISPLGGFRIHGKNRSHSVQKYVMEAEQSLNEMRGKIDWKIGDKQWSFKNIAQNFMPTLGFRRFLYNKSRKYNSTNIVGDGSGKGDKWKMAKTSFSVL